MATTIINKQTVLLKILKINSAIKIGSLKVMKVPVNILIQCQ